MQYGRDQLTAIFSQCKIGGFKETYRIVADSPDQLDLRINQIKERIQKKIDSALNSFINRARIRVKGELPKWQRFEDWIKGEEFINQIPKEVIIHDTTFKKVYGYGIEFLKTDDVPGAKIKTYIKNRCLEDVAPEIASELRGIKDLMKGSFQLQNSWQRETMGVMGALQEQIQQHLQLIQEYRNEAIYRQELNRGMIADIRKVLRVGTIRKGVFMKECGECSHRQEAVRGQGISRCQKCGSDNMWKVQDYGK